MGQKGYCCALLLGLSLLLGATELANAQEDNSSNTTDVEMMSNDTDNVTTMVIMMTPEVTTVVVETTDAPTTMPSGPPVSITGDLEDYPAEAVLVLTITLGGNYTRQNITQLQFLLQGYFLNYCQMTSSGMGSGSGDDRCPVVEGSMAEPGVTGYQVEYVGFKMLADNMVEIQAVILTPEGPLDLSESGVIDQFNKDLAELGFPIETSLLKPEEDDGVPIPLIVGVVVGVGVPLIIVVTVVIVVVVVIVVMKKSSTTAVTKIAPTPSKSEPPTTSTPHGNTVELEKFSKSDKV